MSQIFFSLGTDKFDNQPVQCTAADFEDFITQISNTGSTRKGEFFVCAALTSGVHTNPVKYPGTAHWRIKPLALSRDFVALDGDYFANAASYAAFQAHIEQWSSFVYTTASHTPHAPRARAIIELSRSVDRSEGIALGEAIERMLIQVVGSGNITLDPCVYRAEQPVYTPLVGAQIQRYNGHPLDVDAVLAAYPPPYVDHSNTHWF